jgi:hypothetical protein
MPGSPPIEEIPLTNRLCRLDIGYTSALTQTRLKKEETMSRNVGHDLLIQNATTASPFFMNRPAMMLMMPMKRK